MRVLTVTQSDQAGGAARASWRVHQALLAAGVDSRLLVRNKVSGDSRVTGPRGKLAKFLVPLRFHLGQGLNGLQKTSNTNFHSGNLLPSRWSPGLNRAEADLLHLHFVAGETLSIEDLGRVTKPRVWTLHDMWAFSGSEHYGPDSADARWAAGYRRSNRPQGGGGWDLDRHVWNRKRRAWTDPFPLITPSRWLTDCAARSALFRGWPVTTVPNLLDTAVFQPLDRGFCRQALGLPADRPIVLFGALGGGADRRKGYDLLLEALRGLSPRTLALRPLGVVFGQNAPAAAPEVPLELRWLGHLSDDPTLALLYNAADVMVVPSRQEAFGQTASEAQACGVPVAAFASTGLLDVVDDGVTGRLAEAFRPEALGAAVDEILGDEDRRLRWGAAARRRALDLWSPAVVVPQLLKIYETARKDAHAKT